MKPHRVQSLRRALTRNMIAMQTAVLMTFTLVAAVPILQLVNAGQVLDDGIVSTIVDGIDRDTDGSLIFRPDGELTKIISAHPQFWFYAADQAGQSVELGDLPPAVRLMESNLPRIASANIENLGTADDPALIVRRVDTKTGPIWVMTAGGPKFIARPIRDAFFNPLFLGLLGFFALATVLAIPLFVRRELKGVESAAREARSIDVDQRGVRLPITRVPSELHPLVNAVNDGLQRLDEGMDRQQRFMADAAHELRTPIAILQTRLEILPDGDDKRLLLLDVARLGSMANQLLDLQRMDLSPEPFAPVDLVAMATDVASDLAPLVIAAGDHLEFDADARSVWISGDGGALSRALTNLIQNAIAHAGEGVTIIIAIAANGIIRVEDNGVGIEPASRREIFEPFHRVTPRQHGAGLGLALVRTIVERHKGHISVRETPGGGTSFEMALPLRDQATSSSLPAGSSSGGLTPNTAQ